MTQELSSVKDKLSAQMKTSQEKDKQLEKEEKMLEDIKANNNKLSQNLQAGKADLQRKFQEVEEKDIEINNITNQLSVSQVERKKVQQQIIKLQQEKTNLVKIIDDHKVKYSKLAE